jgi:ketosteroid isomerase-like protein
MSGAANMENMPRRRGGGMGWETENVILTRRRGDSGDRRGEQRERKNERGDSGGMSPSVRRGRVAGENTVSPVETFRQFVAAINRHDVGALAALMTPDHVFVDSRGNRAQGAASMEVGWRGYFTMCPDYWIRVDDAMAEGGRVLAAGEAGGTIAGAEWRTPAAWKAVIRGGAVLDRHGRFRGRWRQTDSSPSRREGQFDQRILARLWGPIYLTYLSAHSKLLR